MADHEIRIVFEREFEAALAAVKELHGRLKLLPSWKTVMTAAARGDDAFVDMQQARDHYFYWGQPQWAAFSPPGNAFVALAIEAFCWACRMAESGDVDAASELFMEGQAYVLELEARSDEILSALAEMRRQSTAEARKERAQGQDPIAKAEVLRRSLVEVVAAKGGFPPGTPGEAIVLALEHYWEGKDDELGFEPYEMTAHLKSLFKLVPKLSTEFSAIAGTTGSLV